MPDGDLLISATVPDYYTSVREEYFSVRTNAGIHHNPLAVFSITGTDTLDLLQRISTNDVSAAEPGTICSTFLITEKAKIVAFVTLLKLPDSCLLFTDICLRDIIIPWIDKFIIMEDVVVSDVSEGYDSYTLIGSHAASILETFSASSQQDGGYILKDASWMMPCFHFLFPHELIESIVAKLNLPLIGKSAFNTIRIENGVPAHGYELTELSNPLETNLSQFISFTKGCYIGQEVIARIDTYHKLKKRLVGLVIDAKEEITLPGKLLVGANEEGWTTSHAWSYALEANIAMGYLKSSVTESDPLLFVRPGESAGMRAAIHSFPIS